MVRYLGPFQTVCDDWNYWWTYLSEHISEADLVRVRPARAADAEQPGADPTTSSDQGATAPVNGGGVDTPLGGNAVPARAVLRRGDRQPGQRRLRDRPARLPEEAQLLRPAGPQPRLRPPHARATRVRRSHGRAHVPAGETFSRSPQTGASRPPSRGTTDAQAQTQRRNEHVRGGPDRDRRDRRVHLSRRSPSSPTRSRASTPSTRSSPAPTACCPTRWCGSPASTSARCRASAPCRAARSAGRRRRRWRGPARNAAPPT